MGVPRELSEVSRGVLTLIFLADMRADGRDPRARLLAKHVLAAQLDTGGFSCNGRPRYEVVCLTANILRTLVHFGFGDDECVAHGYRRLAERILPLRERNAR